MSHGASPLAAFHRVGDRSRLPEPATAAAALRPALFGAYHDLSRIRCDFPLVLTSGAGNGPWVRSLADVIDDLLRAISQPGPGDEEMRRLLLALEQGIRDLLAGGQQGTLALFWEAARRELLGGTAEPTAGSQAAAMDATLRRARAALDVDGELIGCDGFAAANVVRRAWLESERAKAQRLSGRIERLAQRLADILQADFARSAEAHSAGRLERAIGTSDLGVFDFAAMASVLRSVPTANPLPARRRRRIEDAIGTLRSQRFVAPAGGSADSLHAFEFDDCAQALDAFRARLPEMAALLRAIGVAELEIDNHYDEGRHGRFFEHFDAGRLGPADLDLFPSYLVCLPETDARCRAAVLEALEAGLPFRIVAQTTDILGELGLPDGQLAFGRRGQTLARMALGLDRAFVMQAPNASLYRLRDAVLRGVAGPNPALFSVYAGPDYLVSAAACESRAFPCLVYDPAAGECQAARYGLNGNPQPSRDWPRHVLDYETESHDRRQEEVEFTLAEFVAADPRFAGRLACVPVGAEREDPDNAMVPVGEYLRLDQRAQSRSLPFVTVIDGDNRLFRAVVDEKLVDAALRCREAWHSLRELCGVGNSHAEAAVAEARRDWEEELRSRPAPEAAPAADAVAAPPPEPAASAVPTPAAAASVEPEPSSDDPWIETIRCTTCNECTQINGRMFAYNADQRAYIADPDAGSYRDLVMAAETCQVAIIHPGKPRNPDEPGLDELLKRAEPFL